MHRRLLPAALCVVSCAPSEPPRPREEAPPAVASSERARARLALIGSMRGFEGRVGRGAHLSRSSDGYVVAHARRSGWAFTGSDQLRATLPARSGDALKLSLRTERDFSLEIAPVGVGNVDAEVDEGAVVFAGAQRGLDLVHAAVDGGVEEIRLLHDASAAHVARWKLRPGGSVAAMRVRHGQVELVDGAGRVRIRTADAFAVDSAGTRRELSLRLEGDELFASLDTKGLRFPVAIDPLWNTTSNMAKVRDGAGAARLPDGRAIVFGGGDGAFVQSTAELYDPSTGTWTAAPSMLYEHAFPRTVVLSSGKIFVSGGIGNGSDKAEIFDPATMTWSGAGTHMSRWQHGIALHPVSGRVYTAGGAGGANTAQVWDPTTNAWTTLPLMNRGRQRPAMIVLPGNTKLLVATGADPTAEVYDIPSNTWSFVATALAAHQDPLVSLTSTGKVVLAGGISVIGEIYDPVANTWTAMSGALKHNHERGAQAVLSDGRLLLAGGYDSVTLSELGDLATGTFTETSPMKVRRVNHAGVLLSGDRFLVAGGVVGGVGVTSTAEIFQLMPNGQACTLAIDCASKLCVDGVCCNSACTGACQACDLATARGTCSAVTSGAPHGSRSCAPYGVCTGAGVCATSCTTSADCASTHWCSGGACVARRANAQPCAKAEECQSNACADGVCCNVACTGQCQACAESGSVGTCKTVSGAPRGTRAACGGTGAGTECGKVCSGSDPMACTFPPVTATCSANACAGATETHASFCDGAGKCNDVPRACGAYACGSTACKSSCTTKADCAAGFYCASNACVPAADLGKECTSGDACSTGHCVDAVCCATAACDAGSSCANAGKKGTCSRKNGTTCSVADECGFGFCVDGVCCNGACDGQCEACDVTGKAGTCWPIVGAPHGTRPACGDGGGDACKATSCNGAKDTTKCVELAAATVVCAAARCEGTTATAARTCDGAGTCRAADEKSCAPYACGDTTCRTTCSAAEHCAPGNECAAGACVPRSAKCSDDGLASVLDGVRTDCPPYRCRDDGLCARACATSADCAPGAVCDGAKCVPAPAEESDGGCSTGHRGGAPTWLLASFAALVLAQRARRRR